MLAVLKELAVAIGQAAVKQIARLVVGKLEQQDEPATPLTHALVEHNRQQERAAIAAAKAEHDRRTISTVPPPKRTKPGTLR